MPLPYQAILRLPAKADAVAIAEQEMERWLLTKAAPDRRNQVRSGEFFAPGVHEVAEGRSLTVASADRAEDGSRRKRLHLVDGEWEASITAVDYPAGNRRRDALVITAAKIGDPQGDWAADPPRFVKGLLEREGVYDGAARVTASPFLITLASVDEVVAAVADRTRSVSVILAASLGRPYDIEFRARVDRLTAKVTGVASVYYVAHEAIESLNAQLGRSHSVEPGRIRTFLPLVDLGDEADGRRHRVLGPATFANAIRGSDVADYLKSAFALETRSALLSRPLPSDIRRGFEALEHEMRRIRQESHIGVRVRDRLSVVSATPAPAPVHRSESARNPDAPAKASHRSEPVTSGLELIYERLVGLARNWLKVETPVDLATIDALERHLAEQSSTTDEWVETAAELERERNDARALADQQRSERDELDLELAIVEQEASALRRKINFLQSQLATAELYSEAFNDPTPEPEWETPQSLVELAIILQAGSAQRHPAFANVEFTGDIRIVESIQKRDPVGRYAAAFWEFVHTLNDYVERKSDGRFSGSVHQYLTDSVSGHKCSVQRHAARESDSVMNNAVWRAQRELPVPTSVARSGRALMQAHFKPTHADTIAPRMHYYDDTDRSGKVYIGYIGRHLENTKTKDA